MSMFDNVMYTNDIVITLSDNKSSDDKVFLNTDNLSITTPSISFAVYSDDNAEIDGEMFTEADVLAALKQYKRA